MPPITYQVSVATLIQLAALHCVVMVGLAEVAAEEVTVTPPIPEIVMVPVAPVLIMLIIEPVAKATDEFKGIDTATFEVLEYLISLFLASAKTKVSVVPDTSLVVIAPTAESIAVPSERISLAPFLTKPVSSGVVQPKIEVVAIVIYPIVKSSQVKTLSRFCHWVVGE